MTMTTTMTLETLLSLDKNQRDKDIGRSRHDGVEVEESFGLGKLWRSKRVDQLRQTVDPPRRLPPLVPMPRLHRHIGKISMERKHYNESVSESGALSSFSYKRNIRRQTVVAIFLGVLLMAAVVIPIVVLTAVKSEARTTESPTEPTTTAAVQNVPTTTKTTAVSTNTTTAVPTTTTTAELTTATETAEPTNTPTTTLMPSSPGVTFGSLLYTLEIDTTASIEFDVNNMPGWTSLTLIREDTTVLNATADGLHESLSHVSYKATTEDNGGNVTHVEVTFSPVLCADGDVEYVVDIADEAYGNSVTDTTLVQVQRMPTSPVLSPGTEIIADQSPWSGYESSCSGEVGYPAGEMVVETTINGIFQPFEFHPEFYTVSNVTGSCSVVVTIKFPYTFTSAWNGTQMRCTTRNPAVPDGEGTILMSAPYTIDVITASVCDGVAVGTIIPHPYLCNYRLACEAHVTAYEMCPDTQCHNFETDQCETCAATDSCGFADACSTNPCQHSGVCVAVTDSGYTCDCTGTQYTGADCEIVNSCLCDPCMNGGACSVVDGWYTCNCTGTEFSGDNCDIATTAPPSVPDISCPSEETTDIGGSVSVTCSFQAIQLIWRVEVTIDGQPVYDSGEVPTGVDGSVEVAIDGAGGPSLILTIDMNAMTASLDIDAMQCVLEGTYAVTLNGNVTDSTNIRIVSNAEAPTIQPAARYPLGQESVITCTAKLGNPRGSNDMRMEWKSSSTSAAVTIGATEGAVITEEYDTIACSVVKTIQYTFIVTSDVDGATAKCVTETTDVEKPSTEVTVNTNDAEVIISPLDHTAEIGTELNIKCSVTGVTELTQISLYLISEMDGSQRQLVSSTYIGATGGEVLYTLQVQCGDQGQLVCAPNSEASSRAITSLAVIRSPQYPILSLPLQMVVSSPTTSMFGSGSNAHMICTGELGDQNGNTLAVETNVNDNWEPLDVGGSEYSSVNNTECSRVQELTKHSLVFDLQYNNTDVRCVIKDGMGQYTTPLFTSPSLPVLLIPEPGSGEDTYIGHPVSPKPTACSQRDFVRAWDCTQLPPFKKSPFCYSYNGNYKEWNLQYRAASIPGENINWAATIPALAGERIIKFYDYGCGGR